jgi:hypothetical protein
MMTFYNKMESVPSNKTLRILLYIALGLFFIFYPLMSYCFFLSGYDTNVMASQLSFSGVKLKESYMVFNTTGDLSAYRTAQILDYIFMISYGLIIYAVAIVQARRTNNQLLKKIGFILAIGGLVAAGLDAIENIFILATLTDYSNFPDWWAVAHSIFALPKWILIYSALIWLFIVIIHGKMKMKKTE